MLTLLILLVLLVVVVTLSVRFLVVRKKAAESQAITPHAVLMAKMAAVTIGVIGLGLMALMIYVFYVEQ